MNRPAIALATLLLAACAYLQFPESRPPVFISTPGEPLPDGCPVDQHLAALAPPFPVEEIGTVSAASLIRAKCVEHLVRHEACRFGGEVIYGLQEGRAELSETPHWWCSARLARKAAAR